MTFVRKVMQSVAIFVVGLILDASGLIKGVKVQPVDVVNTAVLVMVVGTLGLMLFGFIVSLRFKLNGETHEILMTEIDRFKTQPGTLPSPENRAVVEDLTGWKYEELWGRGRPE
jgi:oligogalacturonide transporter